MRHPRAAPALSISLALLAALLCALLASSRSVAEPHAPVSSIHQSPASASFAVRDSLIVSPTEAAAAAGFPSSSERGRPAPRAMKTASLDPEKDMLWNDSPCLPAGSIDDADPLSEYLFYCRSLLTYPIRGNMTLLQAADRDEAALRAYLADASLWQANPHVTCGKQTPGSTVCTLCLARSRLRHCLAQFPLCEEVSGAAVERPVCRGMCRSMNSDCNLGVDCSKAPTTHCSAAQGRAELARIAGYPLWTVVFITALGIAWGLV